MTLHYDRKVWAYQNPEHLTLFQTTNFRLFQTELSLQMTISNLMKMAESAQNGQNGQKTLGEKEKLLIKSNFSFSNYVFERLVQLTHKNQGLFWKGSMKNKLHDTQILEVIFDRETILQEKKELLVPSISSFSEDTFKSIFPSGHHRTGLTGKQYYSWLDNEIKNTVLPHSATQNLVLEM